MTTFLKAEGVDISKAPAVRGFLAKVMAERDSYKNMFATVMENCDAANASYEQVIKDFVFDPIYEGTDSTYKTCLQAIFAMKKNDGTPVMIPESEQARELGLLAAQCNECLAFSRQGCDSILAHACEAESLNKTGARGVEDDPIDIDGIQLDADSSEDDADIVDSVQQYGGEDESEDSEVDEEDEEDEDMYGSPPPPATAPPETPARGRKRGRSEVDDGEDSPEKRYRDM